MSATHASVWIATAKGVGRPRLHGDLETDVCVVGGGIAGLTAARLLQRDGRRVAVVEASRLAARDSGHTTAHLTELLDAGYVALRARHGAAAARLAAASQRAAIEAIARLVDEEGAACHLGRVPAIRYAEVEAELPALEAELRAMREAGIDARADRDAGLPFPVAGAIRVEGQAQFHPREYLVALADRFSEAGGRAFEGTRALKIREGSRCAVETARGTIECDEVVVATHVPLSARLAAQARLAARRTYAFAARLATPPPPGLYYDSRDPYHYVRTQETSKGAFLVVGGEDHDARQDEDGAVRFARLECWAKERWPGAEVAYRWSGQVYEPADGLALIGRAPGARKIWIATGFSGTGMTFGTLAGMLIADGIAGRANPWAALYDPSRETGGRSAGRSKPPRGGGEERPGA
jgi:glycine/D-amino acid oxidase-like deaminating enzyme